MHSISHLFYFRISPLDRYPRVEQVQTKTSKMFYHLASFYTPLISSVSNLLFLSSKISVNCLGFSLSPAANLSFASFLFKSLFGDSRQARSIGWRSHRSKYRPRIVSTYREIFHLLYRQHLISLGKTPFETSCSRTLPRSLRTAFMRVLVRSSSKSL